MTIATKPVALITGASSGMGKDFALRLLSEGYIVYAAARRIERMHDIEAAGGFALGMDVTDNDLMTAGVDRIIREQGRIDVLINNAGYGQMGALEDIPIEMARRQMEVNLNRGRSPHPAVPSTHARTKIRQDHQYFVYRREMRVSHVRLVSRLEIRTGRLF